MGGDEVAGLKGATLVCCEEGLLLFGGSGGGFSDETYFLDLKKKVWRRLEGSKKPGRRAYHSVVVYDERMWIFGGLSGNSYRSDAWSLAIEEGKKTLDWREADAVGLKVRGREGHAAAVFESNMVVFGGYDGVDFDDSLICLNLETKIWWRPKESGSRPAARAGHSLVASPVKEDDARRFFIMGGYDENGCLGNFGVASFVLKVREARVEWETNTFFCGKAPAPRYGHVACVVHHNIYVFGGHDGKRTYDDLHVLSFANPRKPTFRRRLFGGEVPAARHCHAAAVFHDDTLVIFGGAGPHRSNQRPHLFSDVALCVFPNSGDDT